MILDTNALSAVAEADAGAVLEFGQARRIAIPVIVLGEYRYGIGQSRHRAAYEQWIEKNLPTCQILDVSEETATQYADIRLELRRSGTPIPSNDIWIAALCRQYSLPILSQDRHFDLVSGVIRVGW